MGIARRAKGGAWHKGCHPWGGGFGGGMGTRGAGHQRATRAGDGAQRPAAQWVPHLADKLWAGRVTQEGRAFEALGPARLAAALNGVCSGPKSGEAPKGAPQPRVARAFAALALPGPAAP